jgi:hypothetical protein
LSVPIAEPTAPTHVARPRASSAPFSLLLAGGRLYAWLTLLALVVGALSLLFPSTPSYDPWAWLVWGREILHGSLHTPGGPTWKPLPVIFTTVFALFGHAQPNLWLVVARAGGALTVFMVFVVAARLTWRLSGAEEGERRWTAAVPAALAGTVALVSLALTGNFLTSSTLGYSEGLMVAASLMALDRHIDGHHRQAFVFGFIAALDRPEVWLFWGAYGLWLMWRDPGSRGLVIGLAVLTLLLWFVPQKWGGGSFTSGITRAHHPRSNSPAFASCPFCAELKDHAWPLVLLRIKIAAALAVLAAGWALWRARFAWSERTRALATLVVAGVFGLAWWVLVGLETQAGFSGNDRYLVLGAALIEIAGGVAWGWAAIELGRALPRLRRSGSRALGRGTSLAATGLLAACFLLVPTWLGGLFHLARTHRALVYQALLRKDASAAISRLGGPHAVLACGTVMTEGFQVPMIAYYLGVHTLQIQASPLGPPPPPAPNVIFQTRAQRNAHLLPVVHTWPQVHYELATATRAFRVFEHCAGKVPS